MRSVAGLLLAVWLLPASPAAAAPALSARQKQEYDALGYDPRKVKAVFDQLKRVFARQDLDGFARLAAFPLTIHRKADDAVVVKDAPELKKYRALVFSPHNRAVVKAQSFTTLSLRDEGAMVGEEILISGACSDGGDKPCAYAVTALYAP